MEPVTLENDDAADQPGLDDPLNGSAAIAAEATRILRRPVSVEMVQYWARRGIITTGLFANRLTTTPRQLRRDTLKHLADAP